MGSFKRISIYLTEHACVVVSTSCAPKNLARLIVPAPNCAVATALVALLRCSVDLRSAKKKVGGGGGGAEFHFLLSRFSFPFLRARVHVGAAAVVRRE